MPFIEGGRLRGIPVKQLFIPCLGRGASSADRRCRVELKVSCYSPSGIRVAKYLGDGPTVELWDHDHQRLGMSWCCLGQPWDAG